MDNQNVKRLAEQLWQYRVETIVELEYEGNASLVGSDAINSADRAMLQDRIARLPESTFVRTQRNQVDGFFYDCINLVLRFDPQEPFTAFEFILIQEFGVEIQSRTHLISFLQNLRASLRIAISIDFAETQEEQKHYSIYKRLKTDLTNLGD